MMLSKPHGKHHAHLHGDEKCVDSTLIDQLHDCRHDSAAMLRSILGADLSDVSSSWWQMMTTVCSCDKTMFTSTLGLVPL